MRRLFKVGSDRHDVGKVTFVWHPDGNFLASAGKNGVVQITDRHGDIVDEIPMTTNAPVLALEWDKDGDYLAILQDGNGVVPLWSLSSRRVVPLETNLRDPTFLAWSKTGPQLAVGTAKGNLLIYNKIKKQKIPIVGKHAKRISCGAWSNGGNKLVLGSDDRTLTISNENGDTLLHTELKHAPLQTLFTCQNAGPSDRKDDDMVSSNLNGRSLHLLNIMDEKDEPMELTFAGGGTGASGCKYGEIVHHQWFDDNQIIVGFTGGHLLVVSTHPKEMGQEKNSGKFHSNLISFAYNPVLRRVATAGEDGVRVIDVQDLKENVSDHIAPEDFEDGRITKLCWSPDGQILTIGTSSGNVYNFLAKMSILHARFRTSIAYLSSLREVSIIDVTKRSRPVDVALKLEPGLIAIGGKHIAAGMNNRVYYHKISPPTLVNDQEYVGTVREVQLNQTFAVVFTDSKAMLHPIEPVSPDSDSAMGPGGQKLTKTFPSREEGSFATITCIALTEDFLFYGTEAGTVEIFFLSEWTLLAGAELRLDHPVKKIYPNHNGTRVVVIDDHNQVFLFNPVTGGGVNQSIVRFDSTPQAVISVMWDVIEKNVVMLFDGKCIHTYVYVQSSMKGSLLTKIGPVEVSADGEVTLKPGKIELVPGNTPIISSNGVLTCQSVVGNLTTIVHPYFDQLAENEAALGGGSNNRRKGDVDGVVDKKKLTERFCQCLALLKLESAWLAALELDKKQFWLALSGKAMETLNVELAARVYRQLGDAAMVMALQECMYIEDRYLLAGQISLLFCDYQRAQDLFLSSSRPQAALEMRRDLLQWDQALKLAQAFNVSQVPDICVQYGQQLEFRDDGEAALRMFENALNAQDSNGNNSCPEALVPLAMKGVARCNLRLGNLRQGIRIANEMNDKQLFQECGEVLEQSKHYNEAVTMLIKGEQYEKAAYVYTKYLIKADKANITQAALIMDKVHNDQLNSAFAKACVGAGRYEEAVNAYQRANDMDKVVELKLRHLDQVGQAFDLVRQSSSTAGALLVAEYCQENNDFRGAIEFLLLANKHDDAIKLAQTHSLVEVYASFLGDTISAEHALKVAHYYEKAQEFGKAGKFYSMCGQYPKALKFFMQCGDREIDAAIDVVGKAQNESLTHTLIDFLVGEKDGMPKDPNYIYRLYMALKKYEDAAKTALIIARQEQDMGNYALAHAVVFETIRQLEDASIKVSLQLRQQFVLLHSYLRVKYMVKMNDHTGAARMLLRVVSSVSRFPLHVVNILTSTVVECHRAGLKSQAYDYAVMLMRPEYRPSIDANLKRKIEAIVRRRMERSEDPQEDVSPCPVTGELIPQTQLEASTRDALPMCIVTGRHMVLNDWCMCPNSKMPALYSEYVKYIEGELAFLNSPAAGPPGPPVTGAPDPVLGKPVSVKDLVLLSPEEATKYIQKYNNVFEEKKKTEDEAGGGMDGTETEGGNGEGGNSESRSLKERRDKSRRKSRSSKSSSSSSSSKASKGESKSDEPSGQDSPTSAKEREDKGSSSKRRASKRG